MSDVGGVGVVERVRHGPREASGAGPRALRPSSDRTGGLRLVGCGVDTWKPVWYVEPGSPAFEWFGEADRSRPASVKEGGGWVLGDKIGAHTVGVTQTGMVWAEGHPNPDGLAKASELLPRYRAFERELQAADVPIPTGRTGYEVARAKRNGGVEWVGHRRAGAGGVARLDVTADFETPSQAYGHELMRGLNAATFQRGRTRAYGSLGFWETIVIASPNGRRVLGRFYDKGVEDGVAARGRLLRAEDQGRFPVDRRRLVEEIDPAFCRDRLARRFEPLYGAGREQGALTVADPMTICARITAKVTAGQLDALEGERLIGNVIMDYLSGNERRGDRVTRWRRRRRLRELGLVTDAGELCEGAIEVPLHEPFELARQISLWE